MNALHEGDFDWMTKGKVKVISYSDKPDAESRLPIESEALEIYKENKKLILNSAKEIIERACEEPDKSGDIKYSYGKTQAFYVAKEIASEALRENMDSTITYRNGKQIDKNKINQALRDRFGVSKLSSTFNASKEAGNRHDLAVKAGGMIAGHAAKDIAKMIYGSKMLACVEPFANDQKFGDFLWWVRIIVGANDYRRYHAAGGW
jgi:hypothetical protein